MCKKNPAVSVIIPVYNKRSFILRALRSVLEQTFEDFEVILVDDGSTDGSLDAIERIDDARVRRVRQRNQGVSAARNTGARCARSPLLAFLDADDAWEPLFLTAMTELCARYAEAGIYASNYCVQNPDRPAAPANIVGLQRYRQTFVCQDYFRLATGGDLPISASSVVIPKRVLDEVGGFPVGEKMGEDQHVWWRICARYPLAFDKRYLATYHCDAADRTCPVSVPENELPFSHKLNEELAGMQLSRRQRWHASRYMGAHLLYLARENIRAGKPGIAKRLLRDKRTKTLPVKWLWRRLQLAKSWLQNESVNAAANA